MFNGVFDGLYLEYPLVLLLVLVFLLCEKFCKMRLPSLYFPHANQFMEQSLSASKTLLFLKWLAIIALLVTLASPVRDEPYELEPKDGYEIALILDASQSMQAQGFDKDNRNLNRFQVVKEIVSDFIK